MRSLLLIALFSSVLAAQEPAAKPPQQTAPATQGPKLRPLTETENLKLQLMQLQFDNFARQLCDSINVKFDDCQVGNGVVREKPPAPAKPEPAKPETKK